VQCIYCVEHITLDNNLKTNDYSQTPADICLMLVFVFCSDKCDYII